MYQQEWILKPKLVRINYAEYYEGFTRSGEPSRYSEMPLIEFMNPQYSIVQCLRANLHAYGFDGHDFGEGINF